MHCCGLQLRYLTIYRVAEPGDSWGIILFRFWAQAEAPVTSHWHAFTPAALSSSSALFSLLMIDIHGTFHMVSSCFLDYRIVDMHGMYFIYGFSSQLQMYLFYSGFPTCCHLTSTNPTHTVSSGRQRPPPNLAEATAHWKSREFDVSEHQLLCWWQGAVVPNCTGNIYLPEV